MSDASDEVVTTPSKRSEILGVNDAITRAELLKWAIISIYGVARGWDSVIAYKEEMSFIYLLDRYSGFLSMYVYVFRLARCFSPSDQDHPPHTTFKGRVTLLAVISLMVSVSMFYICCKWQRWDVFFLTLSVFLAAISLAQLIYGVDGFGTLYILYTAICGSAWGINGLYFDLYTLTFFIAFFQLVFTYGVCIDNLKLFEARL